MINGKSGSPYGINRQSLERLTAALNSASPEQREYAAEVMQLVSDAYPGQAKQSLETIGLMRKAVSSGSVDDYDKARALDPKGRLAEIVGLLYMQHPAMNSKNLGRFMDYESTYMAEHAGRF